MHLKICSLLLWLIPLISNSQSLDNWKLYINDKLTATANGDSVQTVQMQKNDTSTLKFVFAKGDTAFKRKVIVMNRLHIGIDDENINEKGCEAIFDTPALYQQSKGEYITFYIVTIPADPAKAALVRIAPRPFCNLHWKE